MSFEKILSDPIYGFIPIKHPIVMQLIEHPYFQRLRRISQLGLTSYVYPGANHTRFEHALGVMHLSAQVLDSLRNKGVVISDEECQATILGALLHDLGHGPFSHTLEFFWFQKDLSHEGITAALISELSIDYPELQLTLSILKGEYHRPFFHSIVSSQLDVDRLDFIRRDSFYTGVKEGDVNTQRTVQMLNVVDDNLVLEYKGIYSLEKFLVARRLMYWQVYLHKTVLSAEFTLENVLRRAREIGSDLDQISPHLSFFISSIKSAQEYKANVSQMNAHYLMMDESDIFHALKLWMNSEDVILKNLSTRLFRRDLLKVKMSNTSFSKEHIQQLREEYATRNNISLQDAEYFIFERTAQNRAYNDKVDTLKVLNKDGTLEDAAIASDIENIKSLSVPVQKYYLFFPHES